MPVAPSYLPRHRLLLFSSFGVTVMFIFTYTHTHIRILKILCLYTLVPPLANRNELGVRGLA
jgi:hypothetical protein